jgi:hypothetical protein
MAGTIAPGILSRSHLNQFALVVASAFINRGQSALKVAFPRSVPTMPQPQFMKLTLTLLIGLLLHAGAQPAAVHPMVPMFHRWDYEKSKERLEKVAATGATRVNFTVLLLSELDADFKVQNFGAVWPQATPNESKPPLFQPLQPAMQAEIKAAFVAAFKQARELKLGISVLPQLDASGKISEWRNFFDLDPTVKLHGNSYETAMLIPLIEALEETQATDAPVELSMEGEMGRSLFTHPSAWKQVLERLRARGKLKNLHLGISANYESVAGKVVPTPDQAKGMQALVQTADFIGISCYAKASHPPVVADFTTCVQKFCDEFKAAGCEIPKSKRLRWSELGHGGGGFDAQWKLSVPAPDPARMGNAAFFGTSEAAKNPWKQPALVDFRRAYYAASLEFLRTQPAPWRVESAYLWSFGSWDVHGITGAEFADETIATAIRKHNVETGKTNAK